MNGKNIIIKANVIRTSKNITYPDNIPVINRAKLVNILFIIFYYFHFTTLNTLKVSSLSIYIDHFPSMTT